MPEDLKFRFTPDAEMTKNVPHVSPYIKVTVVDVEIQYLETNPVQVEIIIRGTLPDQCKHNFYFVENRGDRKIKISLSGIHPADHSCPQTTQSVEYAFCLGRDMPKSERVFYPGDYQLWLTIIRPASP